MHFSQGLLGFLRQVEASVDAAIEQGRFDALQKELLLGSAAQYRPRTHKNPLGDPLAVFYLIARAHREELDEQAIELATFCQFYLLALDLLDDVQDEDLAGKPHAQVGHAMAVNDGLTLLFLGLSALERCMRLEKSSQRRMQYLKIVNRVALTTGRGQHLDLLGAQGPRTPSEVLAMQREKTASLTLICECAALYSSLTDSEREHYRRLGENLSLLVQVLDDVRDLYGKRHSPDLAGGKLTYPLACFQERADAAERERFEQLRAALPGSLPEIRQLLYASGAVREVARTLERFRRAIHHELGLLDSDAATHRLLLQVIDQLVEAVYVPPPVAETAELYRPSFGFHGQVQRLAREQSARLASFGMPPAPPLVPWHLPQWMYDKRRGVIYYPDLEGLPEETLPFQAALLGETDLERVQALVLRQAPAVMAHELFHFYRDRAGCMGSDMWLEELAANALAVAYSRRYEPGALESGLELAARVLARPEHALSPRAAEVLADILDPARAPRPGAGYGLDLSEMALVQLAMIRALAERPETLEAAMERWLTPAAAYANAS